MFDASVLSARKDCQKKHDSSVLPSTVLHVLRVCVIEFLKGAPPARDTVAETDKLWPCLFLLFPTRQSVILTSLVYGKKRGLRHSRLSENSKKSLVFFCRSLKWLLWRPAFASVHIHPPPDWCRS